MKRFLIKRTINKDCTSSYELIATLTGNSEADCIDDAGRKFSELGAELEKITKNYQPPKLNPKQKFSSYPSLTSIKEGAFVSWTWDKDLLCWDKETAARNGINA